jgi:hypothetical protein
MEQEIYSRDGSLKAVLSRREDGKIQVEFLQQRQEESLEFGPSGFWQKVPGMSIFDSLSDAIEFASRHLGIDDADFFEPE